MAVEPSSLSRPGTRRPWRWPIRLALIAAAVCVVLFAISLRKTVIIGLSGYGVMLTDGGIWLIHRRDFSQREFATTDAIGRVDWWPPCGFIRQRGLTPGWSVDARLWFIGASCMAVAVAISTGVNVRAVRRRRAGLCVSCGFDRRATHADRPCPECGDMR